MTNGISYNEGYVGLGTSTPITSLHLNAPHFPKYGQFVISAPTGQDMQFSFLDGTVVKAYMWWDASEKDLILQNNTISPTNINPFGGNVGIGTRTPNATLDVNGNIKAKGKIIAHGQQEVSTKSYVDDLYENISAILLESGLNGIVSDLDGNIYKTVKIGEQIWMAENIRATRYSDGRAIPLVENPSDWNNLSSKDQAYCWYDNDEVYKEIYGALYTWAAATNHSIGSSTNPSNVQGVCPSGWHVPSDAEWKELEIHLGMSQAESDETGWRGTNISGKLKETGTTHWGSTDDEVTNESGFTALPSGFRTNLGTYSGIVYYTYWWSASVLDNINRIWCRHINYIQGGISRLDNPWKYGLPVRCVKN